MIEATLRRALSIMHFYWQIEIFEQSNNIFDPAKIARQLQKQMRHPVDVEATLREPRDIDKGGADTIEKEVVFLSQPDLGLSALFLLFKLIFPIGF